MYFHMHKKSRGRANCSYPAHKYTRSSFSLVLSFSPFSIADEIKDQGIKNAKSSFSMADTKQPIRTCGLVQRKPSTIGLSAVYVSVYIKLVTPAQIVSFSLFSKGSHGDGWVHQGSIYDSFLYLREVQGMKMNGCLDWKEEGDLYRGWDGLDAWERERIKVTTWESIHVHSVHHALMRLWKKEKHIRHLIISDRKFGWEWVLVRCLVPWLMVSSTLFFFSVEHGVRRWLITKKHGIRSRVCFMQEKKIGPLRFVAL